MSIPGSSPFLLSVDLEDVRSRMAGGLRYRDRVAVNVERYLEFFAGYGFVVTFFTVGDIARRAPHLIRRIAEAGHEIACHGSEHIPLDRRSPADFEEDLKRNRGELEEAAGRRVIGYRAPVFSLTQRTLWAYDILARMDYSYSSSVLPARNPLYGWPEFGTRCVRVRDGLWEIPVSLTGTPVLNVPFAGGVYFRSLPFTVIRRCFADCARRDEAVVGYFHPYDIDTEQERFIHPGIHKNRFFNWLMYYNRKGVFGRLSAVMKNARTMTYGEYVRRRLQREEESARVRCV